MTFSGAKTTGGPTAATALFVLAGLWLCVGIALGVALWHSPAATAYSSSDDGSLRENVPALDILILCLLAATVSAAGGAIVDQVGKRRAVEAE